MPFVAANQIKELSGFDAFNPGEMVTSYQEGEVVTVEVICRLPIFNGNFPNVIVEELGLRSLTPNNPIQAINIDLRLEQEFEPSNEKKYGYFTFTLGSGLRPESYALNITNQCWNDGGQGRRGARSISIPTTPDTAPHSVES